MQFINKNSLKNGYLFLSPKSAVRILLNLFSILTCIVLPKFLCIFQRSNYFTVKFPREEIDVFTNHESGKVYMPEAIVYLVLFPFFSALLSLRVAGYNFNYADKIKSKTVPE